MPIMQNSALIISAGSVILAMVLVAGPVQATELVRADYMVSCQGCHLADGGGFPKKGVPKMTGFVGKFLTVPGGREFLVQVPGSAQSDLSDDRLANVLNWILTTFSAAQIPANFVPYSAKEVKRLRNSPIARVADTREQLVREMNKTAP
jgi:mono/diheme cytochrome c family protein